MRSNPWALHAGAASLVWGHASTRIANSAALLLLVATLGAASLAVWRHEAFRAGHESQRVQLLQRQMRLEQRTKPAAKTLPALTAEEIAAHNQAAQHLNLPWSMVLDMFERRSSADIGLTFLEPDGKRASVRVQAEAKRIDALLAYSKAMADDEAIEGLRLLQHETNEQDGNQPARLTFELRFVPAVWAGNQ